MVWQWLSHCEASRPTTVERVYRPYCAVSRLLATDDPAVIAAITAWCDRRRSYHQLLSEQRQKFWCSAIEVDRSSPKRLDLWRSIDLLPGRRTNISFPFYGGQRYNWMLTSPSRPVWPLGCSWPNLNCWKRPMSPAPFASCIFIRRRPDQLYSFSHLKCLNTAANSPNKWWRQCR